MNKLINSLIKEKIIKITNNHPLKSQSEKVCPTCQVKMGELDRNGLYAYLFLCLQCGKENSIYYQGENWDKEPRKLKQLKKCNAGLPPGYGEKCSKEVDPICKEQCFEHCYGKGYPKDHYLRCKNPNHPPYQKSEWQEQWEAMQERTKKERESKQWKYPYDEEIPEGKTRLRNAIRRDIKLLKSFLPIDENWLPDEGDDEMGDGSNTDNLEEELEKIKLVINHPNGLQTKLLLWEDMRDIEENSKEEENYE